MPTLNARMSRARLFGGSMMKVSLATEDVVVGSESNSTRCTPRFSSLARIVALGLAGLCAAFAFAQPIGTSNSSDKKADQVRVVLLGTAAGRTFYRGGSDKGISTAITIGKDVYVVDFGRGWTESFFAAGLSEPGTGFGGLETLRAGFITHLHADHIVDYPRLLLFGATDGLAAKPNPIVVYEPGRVDDTATMFSALKDRETLVNPSRPAPGTVDMTNSLMAAFATDLNDNMADGGRPHPDKYLRVHDIVIPLQAGASPSNPAPKMVPFEVYRDEHVKVSAVLVDHAPIFPVFAFRFDTPRGAIVISGDTSRNQNLIELARGAKILIHEAIDLDWARGLFPSQRTPAQEAKLRHLLEAHTDAHELGSIADAADVELLVLSHLAPPTLNDEAWLRQFARTRGKAVVGKPLMTFNLPLE
jgi:ribonuclease BN (tRNA processing enzyme)